MDQEEEVAKAIQRIRDHCLTLTLRLARLHQETKQVEGVASGFFYQDRESIHLISAGHALREGGWVIETDLTDEGRCRTACIPIGGVWTIKKLTFSDSELKDIDIGWAAIDMESFRTCIRNENEMNGKKFEYLAYQGSLDEEPDAEIPHAYAAWNRVQLLRALGKTHLDREHSFEFEMRFERKRSGDGLYVFSIPEHRGHKYYYGASGAPIVDPSGRICAILVSGSKEKNELYAFPTKGLTNLIRVSKEADQDGPATG